MKQDKSSNEKYNVLEKRSMSHLIMNLLLMSYAFYFYFFILVYIGEVILRA